MQLNHVMRWECLNQGALLFQGIVEYHSEGVNLNWWMTKVDKGGGGEKAIGEEAGEEARTRPRGTVQVSLRILFLIQRVTPGNDTMIFAY